MTELSDPICAQQPVEQQPIQQQESQDDGRAAYGTAQARFHITAQQIFLSSLNWFVHEHLIFRGMAMRTSR